MFMFIPLILCDQLECVVEKIVTELFTFSSFCLLYIAFLYCMWLPIWRIKLYIYIYIYITFKRSFTLSGRAPMRA